MIISPKSTISNWMAEFKKWAPFFKVVNLIPTMEHRERIISQELQKDKFNICITTYEAINICNSDLRKYNWKYIIFDEAHKMKNTESKISINSRKLQCSHRLLMTGTPLQNNLKELYAILNFLMPQVFNSGEDFAEWFNIDDKNSKMDLDLVQKLHKILRPFMLRRTKKDLE